MFWSFCENLIIKLLFWFSVAGQRKLNSLISRRSQSHWLKCCSVELKTALYIFIGLITVVNNIFLSIKNSFTITVLIRHSTIADVLVSLLLDLKKVNVESIIFIIEFENLTVCYFWVLICWWYFSFLQRLTKKC